jgi:DNA polymerase III subunit gamma/tau
MPLHLDHRPETLEELHGNEGLKASLESILNRKDRPRAYMFAGPSGCGKTTLARIVAKAYGCNMEEDYQELNIAQIGGKDESGRIQKEMNYAPRGGSVRAYCLDECQEASPAFKDGMLKALEDTPDHVLFLICTTDPEKLKSRTGKKTIERRCHRYDVSLLNQMEMRDYLSATLVKEGIEPGDYPPEIVAALIEAAEGSPGIAAKLLDQIIDMRDPEQIIQVINRIKVDEAQVLELCRGLLNKDWNKCRGQLSLLDEKNNLEGARQAVLTYMRKVLLGDRPNTQAYYVIKQFEKPFYDSGVAGMTAASYASVVAMK